MPNAQQPAKARRKGPRPRHVPQRTCVACREQTAKRTLTRIVRTPEGSVVIDPTGKMNGRGAYLCERRDCWEKGLSKGLLARALNVELMTTATEELRRYASALPDEGAGDAR